MVLVTKISVEYDGFMWRCYVDGKEVDGKFVFAWQALEKMLKDFKRNHEAL